MAATKRIGGRAFAVWCVVLVGATVGPVTGLAVAADDPADLGLAVSVSPAEVRVEQPLTYIVTVANAGPGVANQVQIGLRAERDSNGYIQPMQPAPTRTPSQGSCLSGCNLGTIQPGASATITLVATPRYVALHRVTASVLRARGDTLGLVDPNPANDVATATANVRAARSCEIIRIGTNAGDTLFGTNFGGDRMLGLDGNDVLRGAAGDDCIVGGRGNDQLYGELGADVLEGGPGNDLLDGGRGNDRLVGGAGNDLLRAGTGTNRLSAGSGDDRVSARNGRRERINCGSGKDAVRADRTDDLTGCERRY